MGILIRSPPPNDPKSSEQTPERLYLRRRELLRNAGLFTLAAAGFGGALVGLTGRGARGQKGKAGPTAATGSVPSSVAKARLAGPYDTDEPKTPFDDITHYNNFYELGTDKTDPARNAGTLRPKPWTLRIEGLVKHAQTVDLDVLLSWFALEDRVYRMRCVEGWSMVIPWLGFPIASLLKRVEPLPSARYVTFTTLMDPEQLPLERTNILPWPYVEGLRLDEAMHPLALLAVGLYGKALLGQNGAPLRLVVPWKYGFKGVKSIVKMELTSELPKTTWALATPNEYGFYANVNPNVDHPRWSQARERRIGELSRRPTLLFNGYAEQVASLYTGMDLRESF